MSANGDSRLKFVKKTVAAIVKSVPYFNELYDQVTERVRIDLLARYIYVYFYY